MQPNHSPAISGGLAAYFMIVLGWGLGFWHVQIPLEVQAAIAGIVTALAGYAPLLFSRKPAAARLAPAQPSPAPAAPAPAAVTASLLLALLIAPAVLVSCTHAQVQGTLQNINSDSQTIAPAVDKVICLDAAGAVISGPLLAATGNDAGDVVGAAGAAIAKQACPAGASSAPAATP